MGCFLMGFLIGFAGAIMLNALLFGLATSLVGEESPDFGYACFVMFCAWFSSGVISGVSVYGAMLYFGDTQQEIIAQIVGSLIAWPLAMLAYAGIVQLLIQTTFYRAVVIWLVQNLITAAIYLPGWAMFYYSFIEVNK